MDCERCACDLTAYLDGELSDAKAHEIKSHLEICGPCRAEHRSLELAARFVETHSSELQMTSEVWNRVRARVSLMEAPAPAPGLFYLLRSNPWRGAAATALVAASLILGLWGYVRYEKDRRDLVHYMDQYIQGREAQEQAVPKPTGSSENASADFNLGYPEDTGNPFITVDFNPDVNPFRSEDQ